MINLFCMPHIYTINLNLPLFTDTRKAIVHRFINGSIAVVAPDPCITQQLIHDESSSDSSFHMSSQRGTCKEDSTVTYVSSNDSTFDNSMSLFSKSSAVTDVTANHVGSADLFSSNGEVLQNLLIPNMILWSKLCLHHQMMVQMKFHPVNQRGF